jgi:hypothetical protein
VEQPIRLTMRSALAQSHVAALAIAVLLISSVEALCRALWPLFSRILEFIFKAIEMLNVPYIGSLIVGYSATFALTIMEVVYFLAGLTAAIAVSRWVYGMGPFRSLIMVCSNSLRRKNA